MVEPLEEAVLVHELDAAAAGARVAERVLVVAAVAADPAHVPFLLVVVVLLSPGGGGRQTRLLLLLRNHRPARGGGGGDGRVHDLRHGWGAVRAIDRAGEAEAERGAKRRRFFARLLANNASVRHEAVGLTGFGSRFGDGSGAAG